MRRENRSKKAFARAQEYLVGGVDSPVRSFRGVDRPNPIFISRASGSKIFDEDRNRYIDYVCSWGASILGAAHPSVVRAVRSATGRGLSFGAATSAEVDLAERVRESFPSVELMRFVSSGTEAAMSAVRVARAFTKRNKIVKFEGCYHGHSDGFLVRAGSGMATFSVADSAGVPAGVAAGTLVAKFNDPGSVEKLFDENRERIACVIVEPVAGNMGVVPPEAGFLEALRRLCDAHGALLIFDEVITGFRVARGGAQSLYDVKPDLTILGKVVGGGMNIAAYGGRRDAMELVSPLGPVYQAGTLAGNPVAVAAGIATLDLLSPAAYRKLEATSAELEAGLKSGAEESGAELVVQRVGSMLGLFFPLAASHNPTPASLKDYDSIKKYCSREAYAKFFGHMLDLGVYLPPSAFETIFVSTAHSRDDISKTIRAARAAFGKTRKQIPA